ncbi:reverse transcriptase domain protein [Colletotrichum tofieldiae]|nr:reverse transcriptase domain protein [Colletotrichum tofieldiae]
MDTAKYIQRLQNDSDWTKWFNSLRMVATVHDVWDYIDPDQTVVNTKPQPNYPDEVSLANFSNLLNLEKAKFDIREREYRRVQQSLNDVLKWMISTVDAQHMNQVSRHGNLREMVKSLKENLAPSSQARQELVKRRYTLHLGSIKRQNIMDWLNTYLDIMEEARVLEIISMSDPREQVRDLLRAVKTVAPDWATPEAHQMAKKTLEQPKKGERWHGAIVASEFRNWIRTEQPDWLEGKTKTTSFATWQGCNEEDKRGGKRDLNWKPECPACPGQKHFAETCHHFNPAIRKSTYDPSVNSNKRAIERA